VITKVGRDLEKLAGPIAWLNKQIFKGLWGATKTLGRGAFGVTKGVGRGTWLAGKGALHGLQGAGRFVGRNPLGRLPIVASAGLAMNELPGAVGSAMRYVNPADTSVVLSRGLLHKSLGANPAYNLGIGGVKMASTDKVSAYDWALEKCGAAYGVGADRAFTRKDVASISKALLKELNGTVKPIEGSPSVTGKMITAGNAVKAAIAIVGGVFLFKRIVEKISNDITRKSIIEDLYLNDPIIKGLGKEQALAWYATIYHFSPTTSLDKVAVRELMQGFARVGRVDLQTLKTLAETEKSLSSSIVPWSVLLRG
jgi:hypothetical protein